MKGFFLFSVSCLILAVSCMLFVHAFNQEATAQSSFSSGCIIGVSDGCVLTTNNEIWSLGYGGWEFFTNTPIPSSEVALFMGCDRFIDIHGNGWVKNSPSPTVHWTNMGPLPGCGAITVQSETWSGMKEKYRK